MPAPPPDSSSTNLGTTAAWGAAIAALVATLKYVRDAFRSKRPSPETSLHAAMASLTMAVVEMGNELKTLRDVIIQSHHRRILAMEVEKDELKRRIDDLEERVSRRYS